MVKIGRRNLILMFMLAWLVVSPYALTTSTTNPVVAPITNMELAAPTITGPTFFEFENGSLETVVYHGSDPDPKNYTVTVDGDDLTAGIWDGDEITVFVAWIYQGDWIDTLPKTLTN